MTKALCVSRELPSRIIQSYDYLVLLISGKPMVLQVFRKPGTSCITPQHLFCTCTLPGRMEATTEKPSKKLHSEALPS